MSLNTSRHSVYLADRLVGFLYQKGDYTWFELTREYRSDPGRPVLGLVFEQDLNQRHAAALRLPPWFSNLLPEGRLRDWIAADRRVSPDREMELLSQVGHDLPGAVRVLHDELVDNIEDWAAPHAAAEASGDNVASRWRFSLAGVGLKFSMLAVGDRLTLPAFGEGGDWIAKFPDPTFPDVPHNEYAMMRLAGDIGIDVPKVALIHRDQLDGVPDRVWPRDESWAYCVRRFDRGNNGALVHIEDLAQVRNVDSDAKYAGNYETVAALIYRQHDIDSLREFARRLAFAILISNGDAHLKNWSLIYRDPRFPSLAPGYDFVATSAYRERGDPETLGLKFGGSHLFDRVNLSTFSRLEERLGATDARLVDCVMEIIERVSTEWPKHAALLDHNPHIRNAVDLSVQTHSRSLLQGKSR